MHKFATKNALFGYFLARNLKTYCRIWNQYPQICQIGTFREKNSLNLGPKMPYLGILGIEF